MIIMCFTDHSTIAAAARSARPMPIFLAIEVIEIKNGCTVRLTGRYFAM
jgi:hypothetical protein